MPCPKFLRSWIPECSPGRRALGLALPFLALLIQVRLPESAEFEHFLLFYPAAFAAAAIAGPGVGLVATAVSAVLVNWFFMEPVGRLGVQTATQWPALLVFCVMGGAFAVAQMRARFNVAQALLARDLQAAENRLAEVRSTAGLLESELRRSRFEESHLRRLLHAMAEGVVLIDPDRRIVEANPAAEALLALPTRTSRSADDCAHLWQATRKDGTACPAEEHPVTRVLTTHRAIRNELIGITVPQQGLRWFGVNAEPLFAPQDASQPTLALVTFVDVTVQREAVDAMRARETRRTLALEGSREGLWDWDVPSGRVHFSDDWKLMLGHSIDEIGDSLDEWSKRVHPDDLDETLRTVREHLDGLTPSYESEHRMLHKDGHYVWILDRGRVFERDASGAPKRVVGTHFDITERKRMEREIKDAKQELELALQAGRLGVTVRALDGRMLACDETMLDMFQVPAEIRRRGADFEFLQSRVHPADVSHIAAWREAGQKSGEPSATAYRIVLPGGEIRHLEAMMVCTGEAADRRAIVVHRDVTDRVLGERTLIAAMLQADEANRALSQSRAELESKVVQRTRELADALEQARSADRAKSAFLATTSHELRTPLNAIIGFSQLVRDGAMGPVGEEQRKAIDIVHRSGEQLLALVKDVLDFTVIEAGKLKMVPEDVGLRALLEQQRETMTLRARERGLTLGPIECGEAITVFGDKGRIEQVVRNLLSNAITFTDHGFVQVRAVAAGDMARIEVQDSGIGIPPEQHDRLFKAFQTITGQPGPRRERTGLGLALSRHIVEATGGTIGVDSAPGRGSTFWFTVPLAGADRTLRSAVA